MTACTATGAVCVAWAILHTVWRIFLKRQERTADNDHYQVLAAPVLYHGALGWVRRLATHFLISGTR